MASYSLDPDEAVILQPSGAYDEQSNRVELVLTNKNIIQIKKNRGFFSSSEETEKFSLIDLRVFNNKANVLLGKHSNGEKQIELYFKDTTKKYRLDGTFTENKWLTSIIKAHKDCIDEIERLNRAQNGGVLGSIKGSINSAKEKMLPKKTARCKCSKCGAELEGLKGSVVKCSYCDANVIIK